VGAVTYRVLSQDGLQRLLQLLSDAGYSLYGPRVRGSAITHDAIDGISDLPRGMTEEQSAGRYQLVDTEGPELFAFASTAQGFKRVFHPPEQTLFSLRRSKEGPTLVPGDVGARPVALIGARGCDIAGLNTLDGVLANGTPADRAYRARRAEVFVVAVHCNKPGGTCFCTSMGTGPQAKQDYDLALSEITSEQTALFIVQVGSKRGETFLSQIETSEASERQLTIAKQNAQAAEGKIRKQVNTHGLQQLLQGNPEHPRWDDVAERCLACGNCTMVCPTCFCTTTAEANDWQGETEHTRSWDSCFTGDFSYLHGGSVRVSTRSRYRQWLTHKFSTWFDQFGSSGCVGCGRCISWCPTGIDITQELAAIREPPPESRRAPSSDSDATQECHDGKP
jgi:ferredoxin